MLTCRWTFPASVADGGLSSTPIESFQGCSWHVIDSVPDAGLRDPGMAKAFVCDQNTDEHASNTWQ